MLIPTWEAIRFFTCATSKLFMAVLSGDIGTQRWFCGARSNYDSIRNATHLHLGPEASQSECAVIASMVAETALRKSLLEVHKTFRFEQLSQKPSKYPLFDWPFTSIKQIEFQMSWSSRVGSSETHLVERILAIKPLRKLGKVVIEQSNQGGIAPSLSPKKYPALGQQWLPSGSQVQVTVEAGSNLAGVVNVPTSEMGNAFTSLSRIEHLEVLRKPQASSNRQGIRSDDVSFPKHTLDAVPSPHGEHGRIKLSQDQGEAIQREKLFICGTFMEIVEKASAGRGFKPATWPQVFGLEEPWKGVRITPTNQRLCKAASAYLASKCGWLYVLNKNKSDAHRTFYVAQFTDGRGGYCCVFDIEDTTPNGRFAMRVVWSRDKRALSGSLIEQLLLRQMLCRGRIPTRHLSDHGLSIANIRHAVLTIPAEVSNSEKNAVRIKYVASCAHSLGEKLAELLA
ncbi:MAG: hypothetical protein SFU85_08820 [Candidatus Methylacidiphilales bacterium]|nr:hypothetical protein [Candidatus Methylacidiphilales bacterium]